MHTRIRGKKLYNIIFIIVCLISTKPVYSQTKTTNEFDYKIGFDVVRNDEVVGTHVTTFLNEGTDLIVVSKMNLKIKILGIPIYSFDYNSEEKWSRGVLLNLDVNVKDGADQIKVSASMGKKGLKVISPTGTFWVSGPIITTNHWNSDVLNRDRVLNTLTGRIDQVKLVDRGKESIPATGGTILATRYDYTGELNGTSVWYDSNGRWSRLKFKARDGSTVEYICNTCDAGL